VGTELARNDDLYTPERDHSGMWINGRCQRNGCDNWFTVYQRYDKLASLASAWPRWCSVACARAGARAGKPQPSGAAKRKKAKQLRLAEEAACRAEQGLPPVSQRRFVSARCRRPNCFRWFTFLTGGRGYSLSPQSWPEYCTTACKKSAKKMRDELVAARPVDMSPAAVMARIAAMGPRRMCPACRKRLVSNGSFQRVVCAECMRTVESACRGKMRRGSQTNADRSAAARGSWQGKDLATYPCWLCGWWHVGTNVSRARQEEVAGTVQVFVEHAPAELLDRLRVEYAPGREPLKGPRVRLMK
jgi:hypothetical protein